MKGILGELQRGAIMEGVRMRVVSRTDENTYWLGTVSLVDYENPTAKAAGNRGSIHRAVFGVAYEAKGDLLNITADDITTMNEDEFTLEMHRIPTVYVYDSEREIVTLGTKSDLIDYKTAGANASKIVFYETKGYDYDLIIYR